VEGTYDRTLRLVDGQERECRGERRVNVHDIVRTAGEHLSHIPTETATHRDASEGPIAVYREALPHANDVRDVTRAREIRRDDVDVMAVKASFTREEVHVLADAAQVRVVVLGDLRNPESVHSVLSQTEP
jgi:hypothetical protein